MVIRVNVPLFRLKIREVEMGDPGSAVLRAAGVSMSMREHGGLASLELVGAGQGSATVRRRIKREQKRRLEA